VVLNCLSCAAMLLNTMQTNEIPCVCVYVVEITEIINI